MKKVLFNLVIILVMSLACIHAYAHESKVALRSDICAYIDYTPIDSYIIDGHTYISVDDLINYGFDVIYDDISRSLNVSRKRFSVPIYTRNQWHESNKMKTSSKIVNTDIKVYLDGYYTASFHTDGRIVMMIDELQRYGEVKWNQYSREIRVTIFQHELQMEFDNASDVSESDYLVDLPSHKEFDEHTYLGQTDENGIPDGIGVYEYRSNDTYEKYLGYFSSGKPNGLMYKTTDTYVTKTYIFRRTYFIGTVDGDSTGGRTYEFVYGTNRIISSEAPNFGSIILPKIEITTTSFLEHASDNTVYKNGCYNETWYGVIGDGDYTIWSNSIDNLTTLHRERAPYTIEKPNIRETFNIDISWKNNPYFKGVCEFSEYINSERVYNDGFVKTVSTGGDLGHTTLNNPDDGACYYPVLKDMT